MKAPGALFVTLNVLALLWGNARLVLQLSRGRLA
jgi:hypothetical protein